MRGSAESLHAAGEKMSWGKYVLGLISVDAHISNQPVSQSKTKAKIPTKAPQIPERAQDESGNVTCKARKH